MTTEPAAQVAAPAWSAGATQLQRQGGVSLERGICAAKQCLKQGHKPEAETNQPQYRSRAGTFRDTNRPRDTLGDVTNVLASYSVVPPLMIAQPGLGSGLTGTVNAYRLERRASLTSGAWLPVNTNTLSSGFNLLLPWPPTNGPAAFYRAVWLP